MTAPDGVELKEIRSLVPVKIVAQPVIKNREIKKIRALFLLLLFLLVY
jgi:hypothetical protein